MTKLYPILFFTLFIFSISSYAQNTTEKKGSVKFNLDNSVNGNQPVPEAYVILDKYDHTYAGFVSDKFVVENNQIVLTDIPQGKYYAEIYTKGLYKQHFTAVITVSKKTKMYSFKLEATEMYSPSAVVIPAESNDFSKSSVVNLK